MNFVLLLDKEGTYLYIVLKILETVKVRGNFVNFFNRLTKEEVLCRDPINLV